MEGPTKGFKLYFHPGSMLNVFIIGNLRYVMSGVWYVTCTKSESRRFWIKLSSSDKHNTTVAISISKINIYSIPFRNARKKQVFSDAHFLSQTLECFYVFQSCNAKVFQESCLPKIEEMFYLWFLFSWITFDCNINC